jgi:hypothetical protein
MNLEEVSQRWPEVAEVIRFLAEKRVFFFDGDGVILDRNRKLTGAEMRALIREAGYDPLTRDGDRNDPESPMHWSKD